MNFTFTKWQGCGNDFVLIDLITNKYDVDNLITLAPQLCDRHYGIGADGVILILPSQIADFRMQIINSDGSEAEMCGNGIRCYAQALYYYNLTQEKKFTVETGAGILTPEIVDAENVIVDMGEPILKAAQIPVISSTEKVIAEKINVLGEEFTITCVSMGNPHCVTFVDDIGKIDMYKFGPAFEKHEIFPRKTNTEFAQIIDDHTIRMRVWERGAAITNACGTGSCATLVAAVLNNKLGREANLILDGGQLHIRWDEDTNHIFMTGPAKLVFSGEYLD